MYIILSCGRVDSAMITCSDSWAARGDKNVCVCCEVRAKPQVQRLYWIVDDNGTTISEGEVVDEQWTLVMVYSSALTSSFDMLASTMTIATACNIEIRSD